MKKRKIYLDVLRIIACFFVIFNHTEGCGLFYHTGDSLKTWVYLGISYVIRTAVPIFFMISGSCLLGKDESLFKIYYKRVLRIGIALFGGCLLYYCLNSPIGPKDFMVKFLTVDVVYSYWYLWAYLGVLVMLPFLRAMAKGMKKEDYIYLLVCHFIFSSMVPIINKALGISISILPGTFDIPIIQVKGIFYTLMGYWLDHIYDIKKVNIRKVCAMCVSAVLMIIYECVNRFENGVPTQGYVMLFDYLLAIFIFILVKAVFVNIELEERISNGLTFIGSLTFGIYLLDLTIKPYIWPYIEKVFSVVPLYINSIIYSLISMIVGGVITYLVRMLLRCITKKKLN